MCVCVWQGMKYDPAQNIYRTIAEPNANGEKVINDGKIFSLWGKASKTPGTETSRWGGDLHRQDISEKLAEKEGTPP